MPRSPALPALLLVAAIAACSDTPTPTQPMEPAAAFDVVTGPPSSSGPIVFRYEDRATFLIVDPRNGLGAYFGADLVALCTGQPNALDPGMYMDVNVPADANRFLELIRERDVRASLWDPAPNTCADVRAMTPVATGIAHLTSTDNDVVSYLYPDNTNSNAFGVAAVGTLQTPAGDPVLVNAVTRCVWDGDDPASLKCVDRVNVR